MVLGVGYKETKAYEVVYSACSDLALNTFGMPEGQFLVQVRAK